MSVNDSLTVERKPRTFLPEQIEMNTWEDVKPYFEDLSHRELNSVEDLVQWLHDRSELESFVSENAGWRFIQQTRNTQDKDIENAYLTFIQDIQPQLAPLEFELNKKLVNCPYLQQLDKEQYKNYIRHVENEIALYREKNVPLQSEIKADAKKYANISSQWTVEVDGQEFTVPQASVYLSEPDRSKREEVFFKIKKRQLEDAKTLDELYSNLVQKRHQVAKNADFDNFRDYKFRELGRFDYSVEDVLKFHDSIRDEMVPLLQESHEQRKQKMGVDSLRPWDLKADVYGRPRLKPFKDGNELIDLTIECFSNLHPDLGHYLKIMKQMGHLDLESRKSKAPGGYNYPLAEIGIPFIFMNAKGEVDDLITMVHEGGHAIHSFFTRDMDVNFFRNTPSEVAELASMSMELMSMDHWDVFFDNEEDLLRAKKQKLENLSGILPWIATISKFQHWVYTHPEHTLEERDNAWLDISGQFSSDVVDWSGMEEFSKKLWHRQIHLFQVPFYYIEYGMAQLGAIAVWKNFRQNREQGLNDYISALKLGYTKTIPEIYETAGIRFDFSASYIRELANFVKEEIGKLEG